MASYKIFMEGWYSVSAQSYAVFLVDGVVIYSE